MSKILVVVGNTLGWIDRSMILTKGCKGEPGHRSIEEYYLLEAYRLGKTI